MEKTNQNKRRPQTLAVDNPDKPGEKIIPRRFSLKDINNSKKNSSYKHKDDDRNRKQNNYSSERKTQEVKPVIPVVTYQIDDHPRAMVLCFDKKAIEEVKPRKYTSGYEIFRISLNLMKFLYAEEFLIKAKELTSLPFVDRSFFLLNKDYADKLLPLALANEKDLSRDKSVRQFYHYLSYFLTYVKENDTAIAFDL